MTVWQTVAVPVGGARMLVFPVLKILCLFSCKMYLKAFLFRSENSYKQQLQPQTDSCDLMSAANLHL